MGYDDLLIEDGRMTVASMLKDAGYRTACIGKWHLGLGWPRHSEEKTDVDFDRPLSAGPHTVGFDDSLIIPASLDIPPYCYIEDGRVVESSLRQVPENPRPGFWRAGLCSPGLEHETCLLEFTMRSCQWLADHAKQSPDEPFFLYVPLPSPHTPHVPRKPFRGRSDCGVYGDFVVEHDWSIGQILDTLDRHGLTDETLVIITSDNGAHMRGGHGDEDFDFEREFGHRSNHIYRGQKSDAWDGGHRVPFFARWPGVIEPGSTCDQAVCLTDLLATAAEINGVDLPDDAGEDSASMAPLLRGRTDQPTREHTIHHSLHGKFAIRAGQWKLVEAPGSGGWTFPDEVAAAEGAPPLQLYDMADDPEEQHNLAADRPEQVDRLMAMLNTARDEARSIRR
jgi:arylsulfatase A-like enzyme